jgi:hypothetical protein
LILRILRFHVNDARVVSLEGKTESEKIHAMVACDLQDRNNLPVIHNFWGEQHNCLKQKKLSA